MRHWGTADCKQQGARWFYAPSVRASIHLHTYAQERKSCLERNRFRRKEGKYIGQVPIVHILRLVFLLSPYQANGIIEQVFVTYTVDKVGLCRKKFKYRQFDETKAGLHVVSKENS